MKVTATARSLGIFSATATVILLVARYNARRGVSFPRVSAAQPIGDPMNTILQVLIIMMPAMVALMVAATSAVTNSAFSQKFANSEMYAVE